MEIDSTRNHEAIMAVYQKLDSSMEGLERRLDGANLQIREEMGMQFRDQFQQSMVMFTSQNSVRMSPNFPPRERTNLILPGHGVNNRMIRTSEIEVDLVEVGEMVVERRREG